MSSVPALAAWRVPVRAMATAPRRRRVLVVVAGLVVIAATALVAIPIAAVWLITGLWLGRRQEVLEGSPGRGREK